MWKCELVNGSEWPEEKVNLFFILTNPLWKMLNWKEAYKRKILQMLETQNKTFQLEESMWGFLCSPLRSICAWNSYAKQHRTVQQRNWSISPEYVCKPWCHFKLISAACNWSISHHSLATYVPVQKTIKHCSSTIPSSRCQYLTFPHGRKTGGKKSLSMPFLNLSTSIGLPCSFPKIIQCQLQHYHSSFLLLSHTLHLTLSMLLHSTANIYLSKS